LQNTKKSKYNEQKQAKQHNTEEKLYDKKNQTCGLKSLFKNHSMQ
jgi:hypothetical protein